MSKLLTKKKVLSTDAWDEISEKTEAGERIVDLIKSVLDSIGFKVEVEDYDTYVELFQTFTNVYDRVVDGLEAMMKDEEPFTGFTGFLRKIGSYIGRVGSKIMGFFKRKG